MKVALFSIGNALGLAIENLKAYAQTDIRLASKISIDTYHYEIAGFSADQAKSIQTFNFSTNFDLCVQEIASGRPDVVGFSCYLWNSDFCVKIAQMLKQILPETLIVFGGPDAGPRAGELLKNESIDLVVNGDGENPFCDILLARLGSDSPDWSQIPQIRYRSDGVAKISDGEPIPTDLDRLEGVLDQVVKLERFSKWRWPYLLYETMRGCPYQCSFCLYGKSSISTKDVDLVVIELVGLLKKGFMVNLIDPTFTTFKKRAKEILTKLSEYSYTGTLLIEAYPDSIDQEFVELFKSARVEYVGMGLQTVSQQGLRASKRPKKKNKFEQALEMLDGAGIEYYIDIIYGLPDTTKEDFYSTVDYLYELGVTNWQAYRLLGLPGSPMLDDADKYDFRFSASPPYELLSSNTFDLADIIECQSFIRRCFEYDDQLRSQAFQRAVKKAGSYSSLVLESLGFAQPTLARTVA